MGRKILIVEDEMIIAEDIRITLQKFDYEVIDIVPTGRRALAIIASQHPDLVLMDIKLRGDIDGVQTAKMINEKFDLPIVYLTANADLATYEEAKLTSPFGYLIKPFKERELHATIEMAFYKSEAEKKIRESREKIILLHKVAIKVSGAENKKKVIKTAFDSMSKLTESEYMAFIFINPETKKIDHIEENENSGNNFDINNKILENYLQNFKQTKSLESHIFKSQNDKIKSKMVITKIDDKSFFIFTTNISGEDNLNENIQVVSLLLGHIKEAFKRIELENKLRKMAIIDNLTGCYNRHYLNHIIEREIKQSRRYKNNIAVMMVDVNDLKMVNDTYGHNIGDFVIRKVADIILSSIRESDVAIRYGGDEFLIIMPRTGKEAEILKNRLENNVNEWNLNNSHLPFPISIAIGYAYWEPSSGASINDVISIADKKMYENKKMMKNN